MLVASIPFVRNIAEYCGLNGEHNTLTSLLHIKNNTTSIRVSDVGKIIENIIKDANINDLTTNNTVVINVIYDTADKIIKSNTAECELEDKITLSIAIRLKAEEYMIKKISDQNFVDSISKNQTFELFKKYKELCSGEQRAIEIINSVCLMTSENIHMNSFMYEPILDMSSDNLKRLFDEVGKLDITG
jgi:hypothetical protein